MALHIKKRKDSSYYYLADGDWERSTRTKSLKLAQELLRQAERGRLGLSRDSKVTVAAFYEEWIKGKRVPLVRRSWVENTGYHFAKWIVPELGFLEMRSVRLGHLEDLRAKIMATRTLKTAKNVIAASFRAMWKDAQRQEVVEHNPFALLSWPRKERQRPAAFTAEERDRIVRWCAEHEPFYLAFVLMLFYTGMRPSEAAALRWSDIDLERGSVSITKSRSRGVDDATKTSHSVRLINVPGLLVAALRQSPGFKLGKEFVFINKYGDPINSKKWSQHHWRAMLRGAGVRFLKFYCTRHTFITLNVMRGENIKAVADYTGTSPQMIQEDYCALLQLVGAATELPQQGAKSLEYLVAGPGFEPFLPLADNDQQSLSSGNVYRIRKRAG